MVDLQAELLALIQAAREVTPLDVHDGMGLTDATGRDPTWQARFEAELARRWAASLIGGREKCGELTAGPVSLAWAHGMTVAPDAPEQVLAAALAAARRNAPHAD